MMGTRKLIRLYASIVLSSIVIYTLALERAFAQSGRLENPLNNEYSSVAGFVAGALKVLVVVALPVVAFFLVLAGFKYISAQGNSERIKEAHLNFLWVVIGGALILGAWVVATLIGGTVSQVVGR